MDIETLTEYQEAVRYAELGSPTKGKLALDELMAKCQQYGQERVEKFFTEAESPCIHDKHGRFQRDKKRCSDCWQSLKNLYLITIFCGLSPSLSFLPQLPEDELKRLAVVFDGVFHV